MKPRFLCLLGLMTWLGVMSAEAEEVLVFAAASLTESLQETARAFESTTGIRVAFNFGGSGLLARQIEQGGPADLFFSADETRMDVLDRGGWLLEGTRRTVLANSLVVVVPHESPMTVKQSSDLTSPSVRRLALADTQTVPAGIYARQYLTRLHLWQQVESRVIPSESVRAALAAVESGNADAGIVYKTDARVSRKVRVAFEVTGAEAPQIRYPVAVTRSTRHPESAKRFLEYLCGPSAAEVFRRHGFALVPSASR